MPILLVLTLALSFWAAPIQPEVMPPETQAKAAEAGAEEAEAAQWASQRKEVIEAVGRTLTRRAFATGVDFRAWDEKIVQAEDKFDDAADPARLALEVNRVLETYGISHVRLKAPTERPEAPRESSSVQLRQPGAAPRVPGRENQTLAWEPGDIAVLKLRSFDDDQYDRTKIEAFVDEIQPRAKGIIIDLRGNGGGAVTAMSHLLGLFIPKDTAIGVYVNRDMAGAFERENGAAAKSASEIAAWTDRKYRVRRNAKEPLTIPVAVLLSRGSASASEIVASALRDHRNAVILGQRSAGKVLLSVHARLPHGFELQYPTADYVTSRGVRLEGSPIMPHIVIPGNGRGPQARTAVSAAAEVLVNGL
jgi:hypothetical protein